MTPSASDQNSVANDLPIIQIDDKNITFQPIEEVDPLEQEILDNWKLMQAAVEEDGDNPEFEAAI